MVAKQKKIAATVLVALLVRKRCLRPKRRKRSVWVREWIRKRDQYGAYHHLMQELTLDASSYCNFVRMNATTFEELLTKVAPLIVRQNTLMRKAIAPGERLALTLRFLATGETFESLKFLYRIPAQTIGGIVPETCHAIATVLQDHLKVPSTESQWNEIASDFLMKWNFNHCIGALDGKHVLIRPPANSGSYYFNYKHNFSIVLLALVDAEYKFIYVDVGCNGRVSDGGVFKNCSLSKALEEGKLNLPAAKNLPGGERPVPFMIVADDAFPLKENIMKPYSQTGLTTEKRIFNYRLSRARRIVENAFGILSNRFRVFMSPIGLNPEKVEDIVMACCSLHNYLRDHKISRTVYMPSGSVDGEDPDTHIIQPGNWRLEENSQGWQPLARQGSNRHSTAAKQLRDYLCNYFNSSHGAVSWQYNMI